jgi:hypothetical protein
MREWREGVQLAAGCPRALTAASWQLHGELCLLPVCVGSHHTEGDTAGLVRRVHGRAHQEGLRDIRGRGRAAGACVGGSAVVCLGWCRRRVVAGRRWVCSPGRREFRSHRPWHISARWGPRARGCSCPEAPLRHPLRLRGGLLMTGSSRGSSSVCCVPTHVDTGSALGTRRCGSTNASTNAPVACTGSAVIRNLETLCQPTLRSRLGVQRRQWISVVAVCVGRAA